jgi:ATP/maltotriose-dependent transcriptional regulator MalT
MSPAAQVRLIEAQNFAAGLLGDMRSAAARAEVGGHLLSKVDDPVLRTSFLNNWANTLLVTANYEAAEHVASRLVREAEDFRLQFALAHAFIDLAAANWGLGNFAKTARYLERAEAERLDEDTFSIVNANLIRVKLLLALAAYDEASRVSIHSRASPGGAIEAEFRVTRSLALACLGRPDEALLDVNQAAGMSRRVEVQALVPLVRAVIALHRAAPDAQKTSLDAVAFADKLGNLDAIVTTYRSYPPVIDVFAGDDEARYLITELARSSNDRRSVAERGLNLPRRDRSSWGLSQREREVGGLLAQGFTNKEIADALFISVATVKVHVNHIFEKLGVHSRTEAALRLAELHAG